MLDASKTQRSDPEDDRPDLFCSKLRRPRLLLQAAKLGQGEYNRDKVLKRVAPAQKALSPAGAVQALISVEDNLEQARRTGDATYQPSRHVEVLIALLAEVRQLARPAARA